MRKINSRTSFGVGLLPTCLRTLEINRQYIQKPVRCQRTTVSGATMRRDCFQADQTRRAITQKNLSKEAQTRARISTLQRDELLTQSKVLEKETSPLAKEANQHSEAEPYKTITVSGLTMSNADRQPFHNRESQTHRTRSVPLRRNLCPRLERCKTRS